MLLKKYFSALCRQHNILKTCEGSWNCILCPLHCKTLAGHHPFTQQARVLWPVPASSLELWQEGKEMHLKSCSRQPELPLEPTQPAGLHPPHPTSCPGPIAGCEKANRHKHPCLGGQPSTACHRSRPRHFGELLSTPSATQSILQPGPACTQACLSLSSSGVRATGLCPSRAEKDMSYARKSQDS